MWHLYLVAGFPVGFRVTAGRLGVVVTVTVDPCVTVTEITVTLTLAPEEREKGRETVN